MLCVAVARAGEDASNHSRYSSHSYHSHSHGFHPFKAASGMVGSGSFGRRHFNKLSSSLEAMALRYGRSRRTTSCSGELAGLLEEESYATGVGIECPSAAAGRGGVAGSGEGQLAGRVGEGDRSRSRKGAKDGGGGCKQLVGAGDSLDLDALMLSPLGSSHAEHSAIGSPVAAALSPGISGLSPSPKKGLRSEHLDLGHHQQQQQQQQRVLSAQLPTSPNKQEQQQHLHLQMESLSPLSPTGRGRYVKMPSLPPIPSRPESSASSTSSHVSSREGATAAGEGREGQGDSEAAGALPCRELLQKQGNDASTPADKAGAGEVSFPNMTNPNSSRGNSSGPCSTSSSHPITGGASSASLVSNAGGNLTPQNLEASPRTGAHSSSSSTSLPLRLLHLRQGPAPGGGSSNSLSRRRSKLQYCSSGNLAAYAAAAALEELGDGQLPNGLWLQPEVQQHGSAATRAAQVLVDLAPQHPDLNLRASMESVEGVEEDIDGDDGEGDEAPDRIGGMETMGQDGVNCELEQQQLWRASKRESLSDGKQAGELEEGIAWGIGRGISGGEAWQEQGKGAADEEDWRFGHVWQFGNPWIGLGKEQQQYKQHVSQEHLKQQEQQQRSRGEGEAREGMLLSEEEGQLRKGQTGRGVQMGIAEPAGAAAGEARRQLPISIHKAAKAAAAALAATEGAAAGPTEGDFSLSSVPSTDMYIGSFMLDKALAIDTRKVGRQRVLHTAGRQSSHAMSDLFSAASENLVGDLLGGLSRRQSLECGSSCNMSATLSRSLSAALAGALASPTWGLSEDGRQAGEKREQDGMAAGRSAAVPNVVVPKKAQGSSLPAFAGGGSSRAGKAEKLVAVENKGESKAGGLSWQERSAGYARGAPGTVAWLQRGLSGKYPGAGLSPQDAADMLDANAMCGPAQVFDDMDEPTIWYYAS